ncbi:ADP-dependent (S)-NAD(P)H-hydrate dehydratase [bioreactor metagenome]|uniref:Nicotinamide nucleotide repair protein n=1 Tax=bioreactor metagenome TaxID=1076179 RepID=A0A644Y6A1_9ZZZZ
MRLITVENMRELERLAFEGGLSYEKMMQNAGTGLAKIIHTKYGRTESKSIIGLVGSGNNGGDVLVALSYLLGHGWKCSALLVKDRVNDPLVNQFISLGGEMTQTDVLDNAKNLHALLDDKAIILDGVIGTGISLPLRQEVAQFLAKIKTHLGGQIIVAVDCPSGIDCDTGEAAPEVLPARLTVCMEAVKAGLLRLPAFSLCGQILVAPIGVPARLAAKKSESFVIDESWVAELLPVRKADGHKKYFGTVVVVGGCTNYLGAPLFAGTGAYRAGAGLVTMAVPRIVQLTTAVNLPECTWFILDDENGVISEDAATLILEPMKSASCLVVGPGIGREETTRRFLSRWLLQQETGKKNNSFGFVPKTESNSKSITAFPPIVMDADALRWLAEQPNWAENKNLRLVVTPHVGEMAVLTELAPEEIQANRERVASEYAQKWGHVVVLKGALTVVAAPTRQIAIVPVANSALAKAGSGDALSGIIAAFIAQGMAPFEAACAGAWIHARAGEKVAEVQGNEYSLLVRELLNMLPQVFAELNKNTA